jgi:hypothetical protein
MTTGQSKSASNPGTVCVYGRHGFALFSYHPRNLTEAQCAYRDLVAAHEARGHSIVWACVAKARPAMTRAVEDNKAPKPRAYCPVCGVRMPLRADGTLPFHGDIGGRCAGSEKKP